jgi:hypothetical protein
MATVLITFDRGAVPIVIGEQPDGADRPIANAQATGYTTNTPFIAAPGTYCFGLNSTESYRPLWQTCQVVDGVQSALHFTVQP